MLHLQHAIASFVIFLNIIEVKLTIKNDAEAGCEIWLLYKLWSSPVKIISLLLSFVTCVCDKAHNPPY